MATADSCTLLAVAIPARTHRRTRLKNATMFKSEFELPVRAKLAQETKRKSFCDGCALRYSAPRIAGRWDKKMRAQTGAMKRSFAVQRNNLRSQTLVGIPSFRIVSFTSAIETSRR